MKETNCEQQYARNEKNAAALPGRDARFARDTKGAGQANAAHVERQKEMGKRPVVNPSGNAQPSQAGLKAANEAKDVFRKQGKK